MCVTMVIDSNKTCAFYVVIYAFNKYSLKNVRAFHNLHSEAVCKLHTVLD